MMVDGRKIAGEILARAKARARKLSRPPKVVAIVGSETPATVSYLKIKAARAVEAGCVFETRPLGSSYEDVEAVIIQLPLPEGVNQKEFCDAIPVSRDADVLSSVARGKFETGDADALLPPVVGAIAEIFKQTNVAVKNKVAVVIGDGWLVGNPAAAWLRNQGAVVSVLTSKDDLSVALGAADIVVSGAGVPHLIKSEYLKQGVILIDAGTSESDGTLAGDADPACADVAAVFTPVPGGVGPIAVACLFDNAVTLAERANSSILSP
jgi:methylenetetrahydrofolate dehydrogenase (NADP+)/methenyltetrahydrofolate cyclohydrolase